jgi:hypothetical protein
VAGQAEADRGYKLDIKRIENNTRKADDDGLGTNTLLDELRKMRHNQAFVPGREFGPGPGDPNAAPLFPKGGPG